MQEGSPKNILIVEDSATTRALIRAVIEDMGDFSTVEAGSGFEALKLLPTQEFSVVITDVNMPDINGLELIHFIKSNPRYVNIPLIIVSTERSEEDKKRGMALGAMADITKPFKAHELQGCHQTGNIIGHMKASKKEFIAETEDLLFECQQLLLEIQDTCHTAVNPDTINALFRSVHTLKGLSGLFGSKGMTDLSHTLEALLDDIRLGKINVNDEVVDFLFKNIDLLK